MKIFRLFRFKLLFILVLASAFVKAQVFCLGDVPPGQSDSVAMVVTNRLVDFSDPQNIKFPNEVDPAHKLRFFRVCVKDGIYYMSEKKNLDSLIDGNLRYDDLSLWVHGDGKTFFDAVSRAILLQNLYKVNIVAFSWPSFEPGINGLKNLKNSMKTAEESEFDFQHLLELFQESKDKPTSLLNKGSLNLFIHSLGNYIMYLLARDSLLDNLKPELFDNLVLSSAAVNQAGHKEWVEQINIQKRLYINSNGKDVNLSGVTVFTKWGKQLGRTPEPPYADNAIYVDFTHAVGFVFPTGASHSYYFGKITDASRNIWKFYDELFHGLAPDLHDKSRFKPIDKGRRYEIYF
jgi:hypothetical protein